MPPLNALRAFEAAARHLSLTKAALELNVTAGALSHQIRSLEDLLGLKLFERGVRSISLTAAGRQLYPGLQTGFVHLRDAVANLAAAGVKDADVSRGLRFNGADHALDATVEGAGVLLAHDVLAYDDLRTGRLVIPFALTLRTGRAYHFVCPKQDRERPVVRAFRAWVKDEVAALDWTKWRRGLAPRLKKTRG